ncbi:rhodanese-related sulfurtransferase [Rhodoblastus acidophilus]|uniref:rhodanese-like domain-containing protein n=1 Tax=Rhodoblastus acidophilus TaxID=1074 RepID=UPI0031C673F3|nr:rhodanese-related sulfurtransferase [Rhodoblastus acidophilus]
MTLTPPLKKGFKQMVAEANAEIATISAAEALPLVGDPAVLFVDVREGGEVATGAIPGAFPAPRGFLEFFADPESPMHKPELAKAARVVVYCASGGRSALAAKTLADMGYADVLNLAGGITAWKAAGGPLTA